MKISNNERMIQEYIYSIINENKKNVGELYERLVDPSGMIYLSSLKKLFKYFHLSKYLIDGTFSAKIPTTPFEDEDGNVIEDDFTERISLATSIPNAMEAVGEFRKHVYAVDIINFSGDDINTISLKKRLPICSKELSTPGNKFWAIQGDTTFSFYDWLTSEKNIKTVAKSMGVKFHDNKCSYNGLKFDLDELEDVIGGDIRDDIIRPSELPSKLKQQWYGCVPDAEQSDEHWVEHNLKLYYLGTLKNVSALGVTLSSDGKKIVKRALEYFME